jgi:hypothetical protein
MCRTPWCRAALALIALFVADEAFAQEGVYVQGAVFADIRQFGTTAIDVASLEGDSSLDATGIGGSVRVGTWLDRRWTLEAGFDMANQTTVEIENPYILALFPPNLRPRDLSVSTSFTNVTTTVGFHQRANRRLRFGYRAGFSFVRATTRSEIPFLASAPVSFVLGDLAAALPRFRLVPERTQTTLEQKQNTGALVLGFEAAVRVTRRLSVVPEVRALAFSTSGRGTFLIRPGAGARWTF